MNTLRRYLGREVAQATGFVLLSLLSIFAFFDVVAQLDDVGQNGYTLRAALLFVLLSQPSRVYELMPIAALIGTIYALSKLASSSEFTIMRVSGMSTRRLAVWVGYVGVALVAATYLMGEIVAPPLERLARQMRIQATGAGIATEFRSGAWARDIVKDDAGNVQRFRFVNVRVVRPDTTTALWRIFDFDAEYRLRSIATAESGTYIAPTADASGAWLLKDVVETRIPAVVRDDDTPSAEGTQILHEPQRRWESELSPEIFGVLLVSPERMSVVALAQYVRHLAENRQRTDRYEIAFWSKIFYPLAILVMMALALPFAYLHVREGSVSLKIFTGVMIGVVFYMLNKLFAHLGLLNTWPPIVVAALPSLVVLGVALGTLYWIERR
ncbi:MAG: LPS export ABC transporter permease LptG [Burkholderiaceae bacterium]|nr:LPS export ABC transporter permease LptG [Burkholderiaceae bacterium]